MNSYRYSAKDKTGKPLSGLLEANSQSEAVELLHAKELTVVSLEQLKKKTAKPHLGHRKIKLDDLVIFSRQLATMVDAGIPLVQALQILAEQIENRSLQEVVTCVYQDIQAGMSFCAALGKHPAVFSEFFINMARAGESSGMLDEVLERVATYFERQSALTRKIRTSLVYPAVVITMAVLITSVLLLKVVPTFKSIFDLLGSKLPLPTQILIAVSDTLRKFFLFWAGALVLLGVLFKKYINTEKGRYNFDNFKLKMPVLGQLFRKVAIAKFSRTFSTLVKSGVAVLGALEIVSKTSGNKVIEEAVVNCSKAVRDGEPISRPLARSGVFPPMVCRMINVGEQTGQLEKMLSKIADFYDEQVDSASQALTSMIEPLVIAFLGIIIGGIVISLFLPVFKITEIITK
jgi:type IV pilus assembly protein PilC